MSKKWFMQCQKVNNNTTPPSTVGVFDKTKRIYVDEYTMCRPSFTPQQYVTELFKDYCEDIPATLDYNTLHTLCQAQTIPGTTIKCSNWGKTKLIIKKQFGNQPNISYNVDYLTQAQYTDGNTIEGVCVYFIHEGSMPTGPIYLGYYLDNILNDSQIMSAYKISTTEEIIPAVYHGTIGYMGINTKTSTLNTQDAFIIGKDETTSQIATLTNIQQIYIQNSRYYWTHGAVQTTQPFSSNNMLTTQLAGYVSGTYTQDYLEKILVFPVWAAPQGVRLGSYNGTTFYAQCLILALPENTTITNIDVLGGTP